MPVVFEEDFGMGEDQISQAQYCNFHYIKDNFVSYTYKALSHQALLNFRESLNTDRCHLTTFQFSPSYK